MIRAALFGAGRMAGSILDVAAESDSIEIVAQVSRRSPEASEEGATIAQFASLDEIPADYRSVLDLVIDFTLPEGTREAAAWCAREKISLLSGVSGIDEAAQAALDEAALYVAVLWAPNFSYGINLIAGLLQGLRQVLHEDVPVRIEDIHHEGKKDAPSGTALFLARQLRPQKGRGGGADPARIEADFPGIEFISRREGSVVGDHAIGFRLEDEVISLGHHAMSRRLFARGALRAACWLAGQDAGRYSTADWISGGS